MVTIPQRQSPLFDSIFPTIVLEGYIGPVGAHEDRFKHPSSFIPRAAEIGMKEIEIEPVQVDYPEVITNNRFSITSSIYERLSSLYIIEEDAEGEVQSAIEPTAEDAFSTLSSSSIDSSSSTASSHTRASSMSSSTTSRAQRPRSPCPRRRRKHRRTSDANRSSTTQLSMWQPLRSLIGKCSGLLV